MFLPTTKEEMKKLGWTKLDIILVTGDAYIDSPFIGPAIIGKYLLKHGYKVGIVAQPLEAEIAQLGEPELFWGVTGGSVDSMVANYTALKKRRKSDDLTPGELNNKRPDRAVIAYSNLIRKFFKNTRPIILGGIEASLRRVAHYDYWGNNIRKSILFDAKADVLAYGMAEKTILELAEKIKKNEDIKNTRGICYISKEIKSDYINLPTYDEVVGSKNKFIDMFKVFYDNNDPVTAKGLCQLHDTRYLVHNPPNLNLSQKELDEIYDLDYEREVHPKYRTEGKVKANETIKFSITTHRGCYGECNFCSIAIHQGKTVISRSESSIIKESHKIAKLKDFKGYITDVGGPTANMYNIECHKKTKNGSCKNKRCLYPVKCDSLKISHKAQIDLLRKLSEIKGVKKVFVSSGIRYDMVEEDERYGMPYLKEIVYNHVSGQIKIAPEHTEENILRYMGKCKNAYLERFVADFYRLNEETGKPQFLTYYLIAAHPGCTTTDMKNLRKFAVQKLKALPEQIQIFTPTPSTFSTLMYYTEIDPFSGNKIFVEKNIYEKEKQKKIIIKDEHYKKN